ncbi:hypothetical protein AHAS_Ahas11G0252600 [Arachis hypogaea]
MKQPKSRKIILKFNNKLQPIGDEGGLLSGVLGLLGADDGKFSFCERSWRNISTKGKVYNDYVKEIFHFDEDSKRSIKCTILKIIEKF